MNIVSYFKVLTEDDIEQRELMVKKAVIYEQRSLYPSLSYDDDDDDQASLL